MSRIGLKLGLVYWGAVGFQAKVEESRHSKGLEASVKHRVADKASKLCATYGCKLEWGVVRTGAYHAQNGPWLLFRFASYDLDGATFAADALRKYVGRFKSTTNVPLEEAIDWPGTPLEKTP